MGIRITDETGGIVRAVFTPEGRRPPLLTGEVFTALEELAARAEASPPAGIIFSGEPGGDFQAGVDLEMMSALRTREEAWSASRRGQRLFERFARLACPTVAAIEGRCLGGGLELSLACTARLAADEKATAIALPEVHLGIIPGFGGTQRLPRLIGQRRALNMILTGQVARARPALAWGLVDRLVPSDVLAEEAARLVEELRSGRFRPRAARLGWRPWEVLFEGFGPGRRQMRKRYRGVVLKRTGGHFPAPLKAIEAVGLAADGVLLEPGLEREAELLADLIADPVHGHLLRMMRHRQALRRPRPVPAAWSDAPPFEPPGRLTVLLEAALGAPPGAGDAYFEPGEVPPVETAPGLGLLRRLPSARGSGTVEVAWQPAEAAPAGFAETARILLARIGLTTVWCRRAEPSPGLRLVAAYLREGERLAAEGGNRGRIDRTLRDWGMAQGPFEYGRNLAAGWPRRLAALPGRHIVEPAAVGTDTIVEEMVAALVLEMARLWEAVDEPVEAGWSVLDVFVLGGPAFRGGVLGAARELGRERIVARLETIARRWGPAYDPRPLLEGGLFDPGGPDERDGFTDDDRPA
jgi:enoyl-CoA hydratase/carnithine racemase